MRVVLFRNNGKIFKDETLPPHDLPPIRHEVDPTVLNFRYLAPCHDFPDVAVKAVVMFRLRFIGQKAAYYTEMP